MRRLVFDAEGVKLSQMEDSKKLSLILEFNKEFSGDDLGEKICKIIEEALSESSLVNCVEKRGNFPSVELKTFYNDIKNAIGSKKLPLSCDITLMLPELSSEQKYDDSTKQNREGPNRLKATVNNKPVFGPTLSGDLDRVNVKKFGSNFEMSAEKTFA